MATFNHRSVKLGRNKSNPTAPRLKLTAYLDKAVLPPPPASIDWSALVPTPCGMMRNDQVGDCTIAGRAHMIQIFTGASNPPGTVLSDEEVLAEYENLSGYRANDPSTDVGLDPITVLQDWQYNGASGHKIAAWVSVNPKDVVEVETAITLFGGLYAAVELPITAQAQVGAVWDVAAGPLTGDAAPNSWGGHLAPLVGYNAQGPGACTWGKWWQQATWAFVAAYYDELFAVVTTDFVNAALGVDPQGLSLSQLLADQLALGT